MAEYRFVTEWAFDAPVEAGWAAIVDSTRWPEWWHGVERVVELEPGDESGLHNLRRCTFRGRLPYRISFDTRTTRIEPLRVLHGAASGTARRGALATRTGRT